MWAMSCAIEHVYYCNVLLQKHICLCEIQFPLKSVFLVCFGEGALYLLVSVFKKLGFKNRVGPFLFLFFLNFRLC
jgi:hypothetical protein